MRTPLHLVDAKLSYLYYLQYKHDYVTGRNPLPTAIAVQLAALQIQIESGDHNSKQKYPFLQKKLNQYFSPEILKRENSEQLEARTWGHHKKLSGLSKDKAVNQYMREAKMNSTHGCSFFRTEEWDVGVSEDGILLHLENERSDHVELKYIAYDNVMKLDAVQGGFRVKQREPQKDWKFTCDSATAYFAIEMMCGYIKMLLEVDAGGMYPIKLPLSPDTPSAMLYRQPDCLDRVLMTKHSSRLRIFYEIYTSECKQRGRAPIRKVLRSVEHHVKDELVLNKFDCSESNASCEDVAVLAAALEKTCVYKPTKTEALEEDISWDFFDLSFNPILDPSAKRKVWEGTLEPLKRLLGSEIPMKHYVLRGIGMNEKMALEVAHALDSNKYMVSLDLSHNKLTEKGVSNIVRAMKSNENTSRFSFCGCGIIDKGTLVLGVMMRKNFHVSQLYVADNPAIGDFGVEVFVREIGEIRTIRCLDFSRVNMHEATAKKLILWLKNNPKVRLFKVAGNELGDSGGKEIGLVLSAGHALQHLDISECKLPSKRVRFIFEKLAEVSTLREILIHGNSTDKKTTAALIETLEKNHKISKWGLGNMGFGKQLPDVLLAIQRSAAISILDMSKTSEFKSPAAISALTGMIKENRSLTELYLNGCTITAQGVEAIADACLSCATLKRLSLNDVKAASSKEGTGALVRLINGHKKLEQISMARTKLAFATVMEIVGNIKKDCNNFRLLDVGDNLKAKEAQRAQESLPHDLQYFVRFISLETRKGIKP